MMGFHVPIVGWGGAVELPAFIGSDVSNTDATAIPSGAGNGDLVVAVGWARRATNAPAQASLANGWSEAFYSPRPGGTYSNNYALRAIYKRLDGTGDTGQEIFASETHTTTICLAFSGGSSPSLGDPEHSVSLGGTDLAAQTTTASLGALPLVVVAVEAIAQTTLYATTLTPAMDGSVLGSDAGASGGQMHARVSYKIYGSSPADHTVDAPNPGNVVPAQGIFYLEM